MSFCAMVLFTNYLQYKFGTIFSYHKNNAETRHASDYGATTFNNENIITSNYVPKSTIRQRRSSCLSFLPIILAFFIAGSRVHDNYHHPGEFSSKQHTKTAFFYNVDYYFVVEKIEGMTIVFFPRDHPQKQKPNNEFENAKLYYGTVPYQ